MKRRDFIVASGSTVLSGLATSQIQRSAMGLDFEISTPNKDPSKVDSLLIEFETLEITPKYLDENDPVSVQAKVEVANQTKKSNEVQTSVVNGESKNLENSIDSLVVDGLNASSTISGDVTVSIDHPDIQNSYSQQFKVNGSEIPESAIHQWKFSDGSGTTATDSEDSNDLSLSGPTWVSDTSAEGDYVLDFDGTDDTANGSAVSALGGNNAHSFAITLDLDNYVTDPTGVGNILVNTNKAGGQPVIDTVGISFGKSTSNRYEISIVDSSENITEGSADISGYSGFTRFCHTFDPSGPTLTVYINGSQVSIDNNGSNWDGADTGIYFGHNGKDNKYGDGRMDCPIVYDTELSKSEVQNDYNNQPWSSVTNG
jgi:hypothetical protein